MATPTPLGNGIGTVTPSFERGEIFLTDANGQAFRLTWAGDEKQDDRTRALPAGPYQLRTYRIVREKDHERWHVSATRPSIQKVEVVAGANVLVKIDDSIRMRSRLRGGRAQLTVQGDGGAGLSIYRDGERIPIDYRVLDDDGTLITSGRMRYG